MHAHCSFYRLILAGAIATITGFYYLSPGSSSKSGQAMRKRNRDGRKTFERNQGEREEEETNEERELEAGLIKDAAEKRRRRQKAKK
ncbi:MAG: hypothetical protein M1830_010064 [Pleopsidium flavum]|nr:MAG: hypothetical protein M1830_010064 [Pleopsidium flavum]